MPLEGCIDELLAKFMACASRWMQCRLWCSLALDTCSCQKFFGGSIPVWAAPLTPSSYRQINQDDVGIFLLPAEDDFTAICDHIEVGGDEFRTESCELTLCFCP